MPELTPSTNAAAEVPSYLTGVYHFVTDPPSWVAPVLLVLLVVGVVAAAHRAHTRDVPIDVYSAMAANAWALVAMGGVTWLVSVHGGRAYLTNLAIGAVLGAVIWLVTVDYISSVVEDGVQEVRDSDAS